MTVAGAANGRAERDPAAPPARRARQAWVAHPHARAAAAYVLAALVFTWPLALRMGEAVPHDLGDPLLSIWALWWNARAAPFTEAWWNAPIFSPSPGAMALSDHRVGLSLFTTPLIRAGLSPLSAYNTAFLSSFALSGIAAYALCLALTRQRGPAFAGGLVFAFHPFRAAHLAHLELLATWWLPLILLALHRWIEGRDSRWLMVVAVGLTLQVLTSGYYFFYGGVLLGGWLLWFGWGRLSARDAGALATALSAPLLAAAPILYRYRETHAALGLSRSIEDIERLSADVLGLVTPPDRLALWHVGGPGPMTEGALFPGVAAIAVVAVAIVRARRVPPDTRWAAARMALAIASLGALAAAAVPLLAGAAVVRLGPLEISVTQPYKPLSVAALFGAAWALSGPRLRRAHRMRSCLAFYSLATVALWLFALGPTARLAGHRVLYKAPYAWLMELPGFADAFRAPARFAMLAALTLAVAASVALARLLAAAPPRRRAAVLALVTAGVLADGWIEPLPLHATPAAVAVPSEPSRPATVLELPTGVFEDAAAMYRATRHGQRIANGLSGHAPPHYPALQAAMQEGRFDAIAELSASGVLVVVDRGAAGPAAISALRELAGGDVVSTAASHEIVRVPGAPARPGAGRSGRRLPIARLQTSADPQDRALAIDRDFQTAWTTTAPQAGNETVVADLGSVTAIGSVALGMGVHAVAYPREAAIDVSADGVAWTTVWRGGTAARAVRAAIDDPRAARIRIAFDPVEARYVRIRQLATAAHPWAVAELEIFAPR